MSSKIDIAKASQFMTLQILKIQPCVGSMLVPPQWRLKTGTAAKQSRSHWTPPRAASSKQRRCTERLASRGTPLTSCCRSWKPRRSRYEAATEDRACACVSDPLSSPRTAEVQVSYLDSVEVALDQLDAADLTALNEIQVRCCAVKALHP